MAARFSFKLSDTGLAVTIWSGGIQETCTITDNGDGTYYTADLDSGIYTVRVSDSEVPGLIDVPFADQDLLEHEVDTAPHAAYIYNKTEVNGLFTTHVASGDHDGRHYTETECDNQFAPGDEDGLKLPLLTSSPTANAANEGRLYYLLYGSVSVGNVSLRIINRTDYNGTTFEETTISIMHTWNTT